MEDSQDINILELKETSRTYYFPGGDNIIINNAVRCSMNRINTHQLITKQGEIYTVPYEWLAMKYIPITGDKKSKK